MLTRERREDMLIGALEGGSNYWYQLDDDQEFWNVTADLKGQPQSERIAVAVLDRGAKLRVEDIESGEKLGTFSLESIIKGELLMHDQQPHHYADAIKEQDDADTADVWFQLCVMGELVYG